MLFRSNETLRQEKVEINSQTGLPATVFERTLKGGYTTRVERLPGGNVRYEFTHPGVRHIQEVIPEVGNKNHGWNYDQITGLQAQVVAAIAESPDPKEGLNLAGISLLSGVIGLTDGRHRPNKFMNNPFASSYRRINQTFISN